MGHPLLPTMLGIARVSGPLLLRRTRPKNPVPTRLAVQGFTPRRGMGSTTTQAPLEELRAKVPENYKVLVRMRCDQFEGRKRASCNPSPPPAGKVGRE